MSRAALWKQQEKVREREGRAIALFEEALEQGRQRARGGSSSNKNSSMVPMWGPDDGSFHWNPVLLQNTIHNPYFQTCCETLHDYNAIIDEIYNQDLRHVQPRSAAASTSAPSTAFCLLLRLLLYRMTVQQLQSTLEHPDSVYIRAIGFLYVRYACVPERVLTYIEPFLLDPEEINVELHSSKGSRGPMTTLGEYVRELFGGSRDYYGTPLPRYPTHVERDIQVKVLHADKVHERATRHLKHPTRLDRDFVVGRTVRALYGDDDHPVTWYDAVIDRVITHDPVTGKRLAHPQFVVTYPEYGNTETVSLGELDVVGGPDSSGDDRGRRRPGRGYDDRHHEGGGSDHRDRDHVLYDEVRRREREGAAASHRSGWAARRPPTTKAALSGAAAAQGRGYAATDDEPRRYYGGQGRGQHLPRHEDRDRPAPDRHSSSPPHDNRDSPRHQPPTPPPPPPEPPRKRSAEEVAAVEDKKRRLMSKYG